MKHIPFNELNIIETMYFGNTKVHVCDNAIAKTEEEKKKVLENLSRTVYEILNECSA